MNDHPIYNTIITVYIFNNKLYLNQNITKFTVHVSHFVKQINTILIKIKHASQWEACFIATRPISRVLS